MAHRSLILLPFLMLGGSANTLSAQATKIQVQVYDHTDLKPPALREFVARTQRILVDAGVSAQVKLCKGNGAMSCENESAITRRLVIRVVAGGPRRMSNVRRPPLGQSFAGPEGGTYASVFLERVWDAAADANVPWVIVLAYATVHEVGHLLLGDDAHTARGLMKANWDRKDYEAMSQKNFHFSEEQAWELKKLYGVQTQEEQGVGAVLASPR